MTARRVIGAIVALAVLGGAFWASRALLPRQAPARIETARPSRGEFVVSLKADGTLQSDDAVTVRNGEAQGKLTTIVPDGAIVKAGDVFCRIESRELVQQESEAELQYKQALEEIEKTREAAQEEYENAQRAVEQAEQQFKLWEDSNRVRIQQTEEQLEFDRAEAERLRLEYDRQRRLAEKGYIPGTEAEIAKAAYERQRFGVEKAVKALDLRRREIASEARTKHKSVDTAKRQAEVAHERIEERVAHSQDSAERTGERLERIRTALQASTVRAPASGIVALALTWVSGEMRPFRAGDQISSGRDLGTISGTEKMSVWCRVREMNVGSVWKGQPVEIEFEALPGRTFSGSVVTVGAVAREVRSWEDPKAEPNVRVFDVWIKVKQGESGRLKPGLNAKVACIIKRIPNALYLPLEAVFERAGKSLVYVERGDGFRPRQVKVGDRNDVAVVIRSGLQRGDVVAMVDPTRAPPGRAKETQ